MGAGEGEGEGEGVGEALAQWLPLRVWERLGVRLPLGAALPEAHWVAEELGLAEAHCEALPVAQNVAEGLGVCSSALGEGVSVGAGEADAHSEAVAVGQWEAEARWVGEALCDCCALLGEGGPLAEAESVADKKEVAEALAKLALAEAQGLGEGLCVRLSVRLWLTVPLRVLVWLSEGDSVLVGQPEYEGDSVLVGQPECEGDSVLVGQPGEGDGVSEPDPLNDVVCCGNARGRDRSKMMAVSSKDMAALPRGH